MHLLYNLDNILKMKQYIMKKLCAVLVVIIFILSSCIIYYIDLNLQIKNNVESKINSSIITLSQSITDIKSSEKTPNTSYAKECCTEFLAVIDGYQLLNKK